MYKKLLIFTVMLLLCLGQLIASTEELEFALFKRTVSPVMKWGENGVLTIPKATTIGRTNVYVGAMGQEAGMLNNLNLYLTSATLMAGSSEDVEIGYTRRQLIWEDFYFTDIAMDTFHLKTRVLDFGANLLPQVALGVNGVSLVDNAFTDKRDILFNPYIAATSKISLLGKFLEISVTGVAETITNQGEFGPMQVSLGADANLLSFLYVFGELQGFNMEKPNQEVINIGAKARLGWISAGVGMFNIMREKDVTEDIVENIMSSTFDLENANYMASVIVQVPFGKLFAENR